MEGSFLAEIKGFRGILYNKDKIENISDVMAPPYDVIDEAMQDSLYEGNPYNVIRLILGKEYQSDDETCNKYIRASEYFRKWSEENILIQDEEPCIYVYDQEHKVGDKRVTRRGFIALLKIEEFGKGTVFPHEETMSEPKADRLNLIKACKANFSQIFSLYTDGENKISPLLDQISCSSDKIQLVDDDGIVHKLYKSSESCLLEQISKAMIDKEVFIADGHHRYETALKYRDEVRRIKGPGPYDYIMMMFVNIEDPGLTVLPFHRLIRNVDNTKMSTFRESLKQFFDIQVLNSNIKEALGSMAKEGRKQPTFGMYLPDNSFSLLKLKETELNLDELIPGDSSEVRKKLDVTLFHHIIIDRVLGMARDVKTNEDIISYTSEELKVVSSVESGEYDIGFLLNPTKISQVKSVARCGEKMPQKSTCFYPKLLTGLVMREIKD